jgi:hypothetical protein
MLAVGREFGTDRGGDVSGKSLRAALRSDARQHRRTCLISTDDGKLMGTHNDGYSFVWT